MADADDLRTGLGGARDEAAHLAGADIDGGDDAAARPRPRHQLLAGWWRAATCRVGHDGLFRSHVFFAGRRPFFVCSFERSGVTRTTRRSGRRMSTTWTS